MTRFYNSKTNAMYQQLMHHNTATYTILILGDDGQSNGYHRQRGSAALL